MSDVFLLTGCASGIGRHLTRALAVTNGRLFAYPLPRSEADQLRFIERALPR